VYRNMMRAKIHRATVTEANLNYVGSITIDEDILDAVGIYPHEQVQIVDNNNGARFETYTIAGPRGSGVICLNGAAARLVQPGDIIIIMAYSLMTDEEARAHEPRIAILGEQNQMVEMLYKEKPSTKLE
jgi:aspartate 1-decarboxylase